MTIHERISSLRKTLDLTLSAFGAPIGYDGSTISKMENGRAPYTNGVDERVVLAIARQYQVSEEWLRLGTGPMFIESSAPETDPEEARVRWALSLFRQLCPEDQAKIVEIAREIVRVGGEKNSAEGDAGTDSGRDNIEIPRRKTA
ncbi:MAG: helix-turn-helix transcriptional regulator [Thermoguttaceae bacterium]|nr:helix-turn-helix transcriptional regulator [Thermoguttaceae bacterium]